MVKMNYSVCLSIFFKDKVVATERSKEYDAIHLIKQMEPEISWRQMLQNFLQAARPEAVFFVVCDPFMNELWAT